LNAFIFMKTFCFPQSRPATVLLFRRLSAAVLLLACVSAVAPSANALMLAGLPTGRTADPGNGLGWSNVGTVGGASGIYLGSFSTGYWVLTANHVGANTINFGGINYSAATGSAQQVGTTDMLLFRIQTDPFLPNLNLSPSTPANGVPVWMVGYGGGTKNWGTNNREGDGTFAFQGSTTILTRSIVTRYDDSVTGEAQGVVGDSGGALFYQTSGNWYLGGVMSQVAENTFGTKFTIISDFAAYGTEILAVTGTPIPEPSVYAAMIALLAFGGVVFGRRRSRAAP